jgi:hypothetical protein
VKTMRSYFVARRFSMRRPSSPWSLANEKALSCSHGNSSHLPQCSSPLVMQHLANAHSPQNTLPTASRHPGQFLVVRKLHAWQSSPQ